MIKIVVCVKQVPEVTDIQVDPQSGTLIREGVQSILNPFCEYALDQAARIAQKHSGVEVIAITMGPPQADAALLRCLELGADRGILVTDHKFAGADTWATAYTLAEVIRCVVPDFNLILTGKQAIDGDTAQVGPELAEILGLPQITYGMQVSLGESGRHVRVKREVEKGYEVIEAALPALVTVSKGEMMRRAPSLKNVIAARSKPIETVRADDLQLPEDTLGLKGSYTQVVKVFPPPVKGTSRIIQDLEPADAAREIFNYLKEKHFLDHLQPNRGDS
jgi:electron transfer flavoprotein beta subunit